MLRQHCVAPFGCARPGIATAVVRPWRHATRQSLRPGLLESRGNTQLRALDKWRNLTATGTDASMIQLDINGAEGSSTGPDLLTLGQTAPESPLELSTSQWEAWLKVFEQMDEAFTKQEELKTQLKDAVTREHYSQAASLKKQLTEVQALDAVAAVQADLSAALQNEEYSKAATLRDQGMAWMQGWWSGVSENDAVGHLLHIAPEFGRYTGRVYTARDLADLSGWQSGSSTLQRLRAALQSDSSTRARPTSAVGTPSMEVFVVKGSAGELNTQVVSLMGSQPGKAGAAALDRIKDIKTAEVDAAADGMTSMLGVGPMMKLSIEIGWDGTTSIKATPVKSEDVPVKSKFSSWEAEEAAETLRALADLPAAPPPSAATSATSTADEEADELAETLKALADVKPDSDSASRPAVTEAVIDEISQVPAVPDEELRVVDSQELSSSEQVLVAEALESLRAGSSTTNKDSAGDTMIDIRAGRAVDLDATAPDELSSDDEDGLGGLDAGRDGVQSDLHRSPAHVERISMNQFVLSMTQDAQAPGVQSRDQEVVPVGLGDLTGQGSKQAAKFEILMPMGQVARSSGRASAAITVVAERVARAQASRLGQQVDAIALREALQSLMQNLTAGKPSEVVIPGASQAGTSVLSLGGSGAAGAAAARKQVRCTYTRLSSSPATSDPFNGLYIGAFGPHGPEVLQIRRTHMGGEEAVEATKVTGDANVPAGTVTFKAKIGRQYKLSGANVYPDELGVLARYKGQGRVAAKGYSKPKWVDGELLVLSSSARLTAGAELGFVWNVPGERKFLILLNRVDLGSIIST